MRATLPWMSGEERELAYYRAVEDFFAKLRGTPHVLSPRDFQLLRSWWREDVPLAAVTAGISEVFERRRQAGEGDPVVSLSYCRHAVRRAAKRLGESRAGAPGDGECEPDGSREALEDLGRHLDRAAEDQAGDRPAIAGCIRSIRASLASLAETSDPAALESGLFSLETALLQACWNALDREERLEIDARARRAAGDESGPAAERAFLAHRDREIRVLLGLPRLELP